MTLSVLDKRVLEKRKKIKAIIIRIKLHVYNKEDLLDLITAL